MGRLAGIALGIFSAIGGFVDMGAIVTTAQAGAQFRYALLWTVVPGVVGLVIYADMAGRVAISSGRTLFDAIRFRLGARLAMVTLVVTVIVNTLTLLVEIAGMSLAVEQATHLSSLMWLPLAAVLVAVILWTANFKVIENGSAFLGLAILVVVVAMVKLGPSWKELGTQVVHPSMDDVDSMPEYLFAAIGLLGGFMTPFQFFFYSSGAIEEEWDAKDFITNRITSSVGSIFGAVISF